MAHRDHLTELLDDIFHSPPVYNGIFSCLSPPDIIRVGWTCRLLREAVADFQRLAYNINRHLTHFVQEPIALRHLQRKTGFLISGSNALQFLDRTFYSSSDLDLFAYPESAKAIGAHLIEKEGYVFKPSAKQPKMFEELVVTPRNMDVRFRGPSLNELAYSANGMSELFRFTHSERNLEVQLITCQRAPLDCVLYFHSTCVMNIITADTAYAFYPKATFDTRTSLGFGGIDEGQLSKAYKKYAERGWTFVKDLTWDKVQEISPSFAPETVRYLDDKYTWRVPLDVEGLQERDHQTTAIHEGLLPLDVDPFVCNSWVLAKCFDGFSTTMDLNMSYFVFRSKYTENTYLVAEEQFCEAMELLDDYTCELGQGERKGMKHVDFYIPALRASHMKTPELAQSGKVDQK